MGHRITEAKVGWFDKGWWVPSEHDIALARGYAMHRQEPFADAVARAIYDDMTLGTGAGGSFLMDGYKVLPCEYPEDIYLVGGAHEGLAMELSEVKTCEDVRVAIELLREAIVGLQSDSDVLVVVGYWIDAMRDNLAYFDVSNMLLDERKAISLARARGGLVIYDMAGERDIRVADVRAAELAAPPFDSSAYADFMRRRRRDADD